MQHVEEEFRRFWLCLNVCLRMDVLQNWHHFQTVVANVWNFAVAFSRAFVLLHVCRAFIICSFCSTSAGLEQMKHVLGGRLERPSPCCIRSAPGRHRVRGLSETSEKCASFCILGSICPRYSWILVQGLNENIRENVYFQVGIISNLLLISSPRDFFRGRIRSVWPIVRLLCRCFSISDFMVE